MVFLDTSVVLRVMLGQPGKLAGWGRWRTAYASELMGVEARRSIDRLRLSGDLDDAGVGEAQEWLRTVETVIGRVPLTRLVLARASLPMATQVRTLDAIHLATALRLQERRRRPVVFATHDQRQAVAARALGLACIGT